MFLEEVLYRHLTRFVVRSDVRLNPGYGRSAIGAKRPILIPSTTVYSEVYDYVIVEYQNREHSTAQHSEVKQITHRTHPCTRQQTKFVPIRVRIKRTMYVPYRYIQQQQ